MSRSLSGAAVRLLAVLCVTAGYAAAQEQQEMTESPTETPTAEPTFRPDEEEELELPCDCSDLPMGSPSGVYNLSLGRASSQQPVPAYCDMDTDGGNWTVFQRRDGLLGIPKNQRQSFKQKWNAYKTGFGSLTGEFWWGLEYLHILTQEKERQYELRIYLTSAEGIINPAGLVRYAVYRNFWISSEDTGYALNYDYYKQLGGTTMPPPSLGTAFTTTIGTGSSRRPIETTADSIARVEEAGGIWVSTSALAVQFVARLQPS